MNRMSFFGVFQHFGLLDYNICMASFIMNIDSKYFVSVTLELFDPASDLDGVDVFRAFVVDNNSGKDLAEVFFECGVECEFWDIVNVFSDVFKEFMKSEVR
jgi:hypothetical protein